MKKEAAWQELIRKGVTKKDLYLIIMHAPSFEGYQTRSWELLLRQADPRDLNFIIEYAPEEYQARAQEILRRGKDELAEELNALSTEKLIEILTGP